MNIYATGMNPADSNALKREPRVAIFQAFVEMIKYTKGEGHDVVWKATKVGDQIPGMTEVVIVSSMLPRSLNCPYALGVIWTISEALKHDIPLVIYLTDWAFFAANVEFRSIARAGEDYFFKTIGGKPQYNEDPAMIREHAEALLDVCRQYGDPKSKLWQKAQILIPKYTHWGDAGIVQRYLPGANPVLTFDPTPVFLDYLSAEPLFEDVGLSWEGKKKRWILPSLLVNDDWVLKQNLKWPVARFGPKGYDTLSSERIIQQVYKINIGSLCPPYPHEGSGWWRSRWIHSSRASSILLCGQKDAKAIGHDYLHSGDFYESLPEHRLKEIARNQQETMNVMLQKDYGVMRDQIYTAIAKAGASV